MEFDFVLLIKFCLYTFLYELLKFTFFYYKSEWDVEKALIRFRKPSIFETIIICVILLFLFPFLKL